MSIADENTQKMKVTITYEYDAEVFDGEDDMYDVAKEEKDFIAKDIKPYLDGISPISNFEVTVVPKLS